MKFTIKPAIALLGVLLFLSGCDTDSGVAAPQEPSDVNETPVQQRVKVSQKTITLDLDTYRFEDLLDTEILKEILDSHTVSKEVVYKYNDEGDIESETTLWHGEEGSVVTESTEYDYLADENMLIRTVTDYDHSDGKRQTFKKVGGYELATKNILYSDQHSSSYQRNPATHEYELVSQRHYLTYIYNDEGQLWQITQQDMDISTEEYGLPFTISEFVYLPDSHTIQRNQYLRDGTLGAQDIWQDGYLTEFTAFSDVTESGLSSKVVNAYDDGKFKKASYYQANDNNASGLSLTREDSIFYDPFDRLDYSVIVTILGREPFRTRNTVRRYIYNHELNLRLSYSFIFEIQGDEIVWRYDPSGKVTIEQYQTIKCGEYSQIVNRHDRFGRQFNPDVCTKPVDKPSTTSFLDTNEIATSILEASERYRTD